MRKAYGADVAKRLRQRLTDLREAASVEELLHNPGRWEQLTADRVGYWSGRLSANWRLIVGPTGDGLEVVVIEVVDYH
jgi:proteic killer suppression protein